VLRYPWRATPLQKLIFSIALGLALAPVAANAAPLTYLVGHGTKAYPVVALTWGVLVISIAVVIIIALLLAVAVWRRRTAATEIAHPPGGLRWVWIGTGISTVVLLISCVWTMVVLAQVSTAGKKPPPYVIEITGRQWWWEVHYVSSEASRNFTTANEIHVPTGTPIEFKLIGGDVIHSFWIPQLSGKTDTIPGQTNEMWLEASKPGTYAGQCTEYCGPQHAHMKMLLIVQTLHDFHAWWNHQLALAAQPASASARAGLNTFTVHCGACHAVRGTDAAGVYGPDLSHLMTRKTIAAGTLPNNQAYLLGWISDPQGKKPGSFMPRPDLTGPELQNVRSFLLTLK